MMTDAARNRRPVASPRSRIAGRFGRGLTGLAIVLASMAPLAACGEASNHDRAVAVLIDIQNEYASEMDKASRLTNYLLPRLNPGDSIAVIFIDNRSYTERNYIARTTFDDRPSIAIQQKRHVRAGLDAFMNDFEVPSAHSDITGGVLLARDFLRESEAGERYMFLVSNLDEDLKPSLNRDVPLELEGIEVVAVNVTRQLADNRDPQAYQRRLAQWQKRVEQAGGQWRVANDLARVERMALVR